MSNFKYLYQELSPNGLVYDLSPRIIHDDLKDKVLKESFKGLDSGVVFKGDSIFSFIKTYVEIADLTSDESAEVISKGIPSLDVAIKSSNLFVGVAEIAKRSAQYNSMSGDSFKFTKVGHDAQYALDVLDLGGLIIDEQVTLKSKEGAVLKLTPLASEGFLREFEKVWELGGIAQSVAEFASASLYIEKLLSLECLPTHPVL